MAVYICQFCGRAIQTEREPRFCYFDGSPMKIGSPVEPLTPEDTAAMQISFTHGSDMYEFPGDVRMDPFTWELLPERGTGRTLHDHQAAL